MSFLALSGRGSSLVQIIRLSFVQPGNLYISHVGLIDVTALLKVYLSCSDGPCSNQWLPVVTLSTSRSHCVPLVKKTNSYLVPLQKRSSHTQVPNLISGPNMHINLFCAQMNIFFIWWSIYSQITIPTVHN